MAIAVVAASENSATTGTALSVAAPTGTSAGHVVIVACHANGQTTLADNNHTVTGSNLTSGFADDVTTTDTASVSPTANALILLSVTSRNALSTEPATPTVSGNGLTWVLVNSAYWDTTTSSRRKTFVFRAMGSSPSAGAITINPGETTTILWSVDQFTNVDTSGTNGSGAIVQSVSATDETTTTTIVATLAAFSSANNATYGSFGKADHTNGFSPGTGFTELSDNGATLSTRHTAEWRNDNDTSVDVTYASQAQSGGVAIEIKANSGFTEATNFADYKPNTTSGHTASVFYRVIQAGDPTTYNFTSGASGRWAVGAVAISGQHADIFDIAPNTANAANADDSASGTITIPSITTTVANTLLIALGFSDDGTGGAGNIDTGYTERCTPSNQPLVLSTKPQVAAGASGTGSYVATTSAARFCVQFAVKEAVAAATSYVGTKMLLGVGL